MNTSQIAVQATFLAVNIILTFSNMYYYLYRRILKLDNRRFHLMMFILIQVSFSAEIIFIGLYITQLCNNQSYDVLMYGTFAVSWMIQNIVHSIFATKYWVVSRKVNELMSMKNDPWLWHKSVVLLYGQIAFCIIDAVVWAFLMIKYGFEPWM